MVYLDDECHEKCMLWQVKGIKCLFWKDADSDSSKTCSRAPWQPSAIYLLPSLCFKKCT